MRFRQPDYILLGVVGILVIFGLIMVSSASVGISQEKYQESYFYLKNQIIRGVVPGIALGFILYLIPYRFWRRLALLMLLVNIGLLILVFVPGIGASHGGAKRWISAGFFSPQPSEILKITFIIYLASWLSAKGHAIKKFSESVIPFLILLGLIALLLIMEPDFGTLGVISLTALAMFILAGGRFIHVMLFLVGGIAFVGIASMIFPHASDRIQRWRNPEIDPAGKGYQVNQAWIALGSGGFFGKGLGQSVQKFKYLPDPATDSIAAVIGEEMGFFGLCCLLALFLIFTFRGFQISARAPDDFGKLLAGGLTSWIILQVLINISAISGIIPLTGITLPFISFGGSSLVACLIGIGILLNISRYSK